MSPDVDYYRNQLELKHDGATVLEVASKGMFFDEDKANKTSQSENNPTYIRLRTEYILLQLKIDRQKKRRKIIKQIEKILQTRDQKEFIGLVESEARLNAYLKDDLAINVIPFPGNENTYRDEIPRNVARKRILGVLEKVKEFCEGKEEKKEEKIVINPPASNDSDYDFVD